MAFLLILTKNMQFKENISRKMHQPLEKDSANKKVIKWLYDYREMNGWEFYIHMRESRAILRGPNQI